MSTTNSGPSKWISTLLLKKNMFKQNVTLTHKGERNIMNHVGGFFTILIFTLLFLYGLVLSKRLIDKTDIQWNQNIYKTSNVNSKDQNTTLTDFDDIEVMVAFQVNFPAVTFEEINKIGAFKMYHETNTFGVGNETNKIASVEINSIE